MASRCRYIAASRQVFLAVQTSSNATDRSTTAGQTQNCTGIHPCSWPTNGASSLILPHISSRCTPDPEISGTPRIPIRSLPTPCRRNPGSCIRWTYTTRPGSIMDMVCSSDSTCILPHTKWERGGLQETWVPHPPCRKHLEHCRLQVPGPMSGMPSPFQGIPIIPERCRYPSTAPRYSSSR